MTYQFEVTLRVSCRPRHNPTISRDKVEMRELILKEIRRLAAGNGGVPPGRGSFSRVTGITPAKWNGVYWVSWGDALKEAGFQPNILQRKLDSASVLAGVGGLCRKLGRLPTHAEIKFERRSNRSLPAHSTVTNHFPTNSVLATALRQMAETDSEWSDLLKIIPEPVSKPQASVRPVPIVPEAVVYLLKSGKHYKIGKSDDIERRFREIKIALPEAVTLVHTIRTDDPSGIEAYWHRRFSDRRANGEWFALSAEDVKAFRRRTFQ
jgi:hypothetical protein